MDWNVYIDGKKTSNFKVSPYFNAVIVPSGRHLVEYKFQKQFYEKGLILLSIILISVCLFIILCNNISAYTFYLKEKLISYILVISQAFLQLVLFVAVIFVILLNI